MDVVFLRGYNASSALPFLFGAQTVELDLKTVVPCCSGPKRPQDKVAVSDMKKDFESCLGAKVGPQEAGESPPALLPAQFLGAQASSQRPR